MNKRTIKINADAHGINDFAYCKEAARRLFGSIRTVPDDYEIIIYATVFVDQDIEYYSSGSDSVEPSAKIIKFLSVTDYSLFAGGHRVYGLRKEIMEEIKSFIN